MSLPGITHLPDKAAVIIYYILFRFDEEIHQDEGDYKLCFSNYMSTWSEKHVWFEVKIVRDLKK